MLARWLLDAGLLAFLQTDLSIKFAGIKGYKKNRMQITKIRKSKAATLWRQHYLIITEEPGYRIDERLRSRVAPLRGAGGFWYHCVDVFR